jgi:hypothetical protein
MQVNREIVFQPFNTYVLAVGVGPTQIFPAQTKADLIDSFVVSVDAGAANNVFIGGNGVTIANGLEIVAGGGPINFVIRNQNQHYELQEPAIAIAEMIGCVGQFPKAIPFIVWDLSQVYLVAAAATNVRIALFRAPFI